MDMHLNFTFNPALHFSALAIKLFFSGTKLFQAAMKPQHYKPVFI